ncbi:MAG: carbon storage regulator CsrA [Clostridiales bacterium]|nr:carbon storage regulator CsrA [Clostridiales bacterium]
MLVLTRKLDEGIVLSGDIVIKILGIEDGKVKIGIEAPKHIEIHREEIFELIKNENKNAININIEQLKKL